MVMRCVFLKIMQHLVSNITRLSVVNYDLPFNFKFSYEA